LRTRGLAGFIYGGHGEGGGLLVSPKYLKQVYPYNLSVKYKLGFAQLYACESNMGNWRSIVSSSGTIVTMVGEVNVYNAYPNMVIE
jgi:hypothetical protein